MVRAGPPRIESALPAFLEFARGSVLVAHNAGFDISLPQGGGARAPAHPWPGFARARHGPPGPPAGHASDEAPNHRLGSLAAALRRDDDARPPRAARRPRHRRRPARAARAGRQPRRRTPSRSSRATPRGSRPAQRRKRFLAEHLPPRRASTSSRTSDGRVLYVGTSPRHPHPRPLLLHRLRAAHPDGRDGAARHERAARSSAQTTLEAQVRELRLIAAAQAALQPTFEEPRAGHLGQADQRAASPGCSIVREVAPTAPATSARSARALPPRPPSPPSTRSCRCASAPGALSASGDVCELRARPTWAGAAPRARARSPSRTTPSSSATRSASSPATPARSPTRCARRMSGLVGAGALRGRRHGPRPAAPPRPRRRPGPAHRPAGVQPAEIVAARRSEPGGWELVCVRHGRLAGTTVSPARCRPDALRPNALPATAEVVEAPLPPSARGHARGDRDHPALARVTRRAHRRDRRRVDLPGAAAPVASDALDERRPSDVAPFDRDLPVAG